MPKRRMLLCSRWIVVLVFWALPALAEVIVDTAWVRRYNGPGNYRDDATAIAADGSSNIYVTGYTYGGTHHTTKDCATIKYYPNGDTAWARIYNGPRDSEDYGASIAVDHSGDVYVAGYTYHDWVTLKYYPNGDTAWARLYNGPANTFDAAVAIAVDSAGNAHVTGYVTTSGTYPEGCDYATIKYYPNGDTAWVRSYNGPGNSSDVAWAIAVDGSNIVYVTGESFGSGTYRDYATIKYYANGDTAWVRRYGGPGNSHDGVYAMAIDDFGNVYVTGPSGGIGTESDFATIMYYPNGDTAWVRRYNEPGEETESGHAIAVDDSGNVCVTGHSSYGGYCTIKYDPNGNLLWVRYYGGFSRNDAAMDIAVDDAGGIYVTGNSTGAGTGKDYATVKYYPDGKTAWIARYYGQPGYSKDRARAIAIDGHRNVCVTGFSNNGEYQTWFDYATIKYVDTGRLRGDVNADGVIDVGDVVYLITYLYRGGDPPVPMEAGDANCDDIVNVADIVYLVNYLFRGGDPPRCS